MDEPITVEQARNMEDVAGAVYETILNFMEIVEAEGMEHSDQVLYLEMIWEHRLLDAEKIRRELEG